MNERIKELAEQAYEQKPLMVPNPETFEIEHKIGNSGVPMYHKVFNQDKFAELIVRECAELTLDYKNDSHYNGWLDYRDEIKKHFGIKE